MNGSLAPHAGAPRAEIRVDLSAVTHNVAVLRSAAPDALMMTVVKADGYGHGMSEVATAARRGGADWLGVAVLEEAMALRAAGDTGPILTWLSVPGEDHAPAVAAAVDVAAYSVAQLDEIAGAAARTGVQARVHLKVDTGLSRGGAGAEDWPGLVAAAASREADGEIRVAGVWSHLACADQPDHPANDLQEARFRTACETARRAGLDPELCHLANSAATLLRPRAHFDLVRCGIASYGLTPSPESASSAELGLRPAMTVTSRLAVVKQIAAGEGVSYGHQFVAEEEMWVGVVPVGYGDGVPRHASGTAEVQVGGRRRRILGRVCMDQLVVEVDPGSEVGDPVVLFGGDHPDHTDAPSAQDWAEACGTISYEIVTRIGGRMTRRHVDAPGATR